MQRDRDPKSGPEHDKAAVSISSVVIATESGTQSREILVTDLPAHWVDGLLAAMCDLPLAAGEVGVVQAVIDAIKRVMPGVAVGATIVREGETRVLRAASVAPDTVETLTSRMFPGLAHERSVELPDAAVTLHLASDDAGVLDETGPAVKLAKRAGKVVRAALDRVQEHEERIALGQELFAQREQLIFAEKLATLGQMAAGLVHELNNPLTAIIAYTDYLLKRSAQRGDSDEAERLRRIAESAHRMQRFTRDLASYARPSSDTPQPVVISMIIDQALSFCEHLLQENGVLVTRDFGDGVLPVRGMPEQLAQVFVNLLTNACHAMPERGGTLLLKTELDENEMHARVTVEDNGHGITPENLPHLFRPFFTTKLEGQGTGLGLAIVKQIVEAHEGSIVVESAKGNGSRFIIVLPVAQGPHSQRVTRP